MGKYLIPLHGIGLHRGYVVFVKHFFEQAGFRVVDVDLWGFGCTTTHDRGDIGSFYDYTKELSQISSEIVKNDHHAEIFVWGENAGGTIALMYGVEHPRFLKGVMAVNPILSPQLGLSRMQKIKYHILSQFMPNTRIEFPFLFQDLTDDEKVIAALAGDELVCHSITARYWRALSQACLFLWGDAKGMRVPFLIQYSKGSNLVSEWAIDHFFSVAPVGLKLKEAIEGPFLLALSQKREEIFKKALSFANLCTDRSRAR